MCCRSVSFIIHQIDDEQTITKLMHDFSKQEMMWKKERWRQRWFNKLETKNSIRTSGFFQFDRWRDRERERKREREGKQVLATHILFDFVTRSRWICIFSRSILCVSARETRGPLRWRWTRWQWWLRLGIHLIGLRIDRLHRCRWISWVAKATERISRRCRCRRWRKFEWIFSWCVSACCWAGPVTRSIGSVRCGVLRSGSFVIASIVIATCSTIAVTAIESWRGATIAGLDWTTTTWSFITKTTRSTVSVRSSITRTIAWTATTHAASTSSIES